MPTLISRETMNAPTSESSPPGTTEWVAAQGRRLGRCHGRGSARGSAGRRGIAPNVILVASVRVG
jgi:hypothetical protein